MELAKTFGGKKFMWDGKVYSNQNEANDVEQQYRSNGFDVESVEENGQYFLFTRRVVKEIEVKPS
jgi:ribosomal protein S24E